MHKAKIATKNPPKEVHKISKISPAELFFTKSVRPVKFAALPKKFDVDMILNLVGQDLVGQETAWSLEVKY